jgi:hypothetical protein
MARQFDARTLLKQLAVPLLEQFFQRSELYDLPWGKIAESGDIQPIYQAWQDLPDPRRQEVQLVLQDVVELATDRALQALAGELAVYAPERAWEFAACRTRPNKALWFYLNCRELFERAALFARADSLSVGHLSVRRNGLPHVAIEVGPGLKQALAAALRDHFWPQEMRGRHCHIEHYTRADGNEYFFAYLDDWPDARLVFDDQGQLTSKSERFAFSVVFIFDPSAGVLEVITKGGQKAYFPLQRAFCQAAFDMEVQPVDPLRPPCIACSRSWNPDSTTRWKSVMGFRAFACVASVCSPMRTLIRSTPRKSSFAIRLRSRITAVKFMPASKPTACRPIRLLCSRPPSSFVSENVAPPEHEP